MPECDSCDDCSCEDRNEVKLCERCGGIGQVSKKPVFFKLTRGPKEMVPCTDCNGTGIEKENKDKGL